MSKQQQQQKPQAGVKAFTVNTDVVDDGIDVKTTTTTTKTQGGVKALTVNTNVVDDSIDVKTKQNNNNEGGVKALTVNADTADADVRTLLTPTLQMLMSEQTTKNTTRWSQSTHC